MLVALCGLFLMYSITDVKALQTRPPLHAAKAALESVDSFRESLLHQFYHLTNREDHHQRVNADSTKCLTLETISPNIRRMEYAVRGQVVSAADEIAQELQEHPESHPFDHIVYGNIGNPHSVGQKPLTWPRQVLALVDLPDALGVDHPQAYELFPSDAIQRAREIKATALSHGSSGAYSHSKGALAFRKDVAAFIEKRDGGVPADPESIYLTNGASQGIVSILNTIMANSHVGVLLPIPQYPLYSATIDLFGGHKVAYHLNEKDNWALDIDELERSFQHACHEGIDVRALIVINPGNPTGSVLSRENLHQVVRFCSKHKLVLLADEVYQENVYDENAEFISCKRACFETGLLESDAIELVSFHSTSKGVFGECGRRGGFMELVGIDPPVMDQIYKLASSGLCSSTSGQIMTSLMVRGPKPDDESYASHQSEMNQILESLKQRSEILSKGLNRIAGFSCQHAQGSMYCFPSVAMPDRAIEAAENEGISADTFYALSLLKEKGICVVPASGFGQRSGRYGFRTTFLPDEQEIQNVVQDIRDHYNTFCVKYS